jgi:hypothetical protein
MAAPINNVGDTKQFILAGAPAAGNGYAFTWNWWDNSVSVTTVPHVAKRINQGGTLPYNLVQSDAFGRNVTYSGSIIVNQPPQLVGAPTISVNDQAFPFNTLLNGTAADPDHPGGVELSFAWYNGSSFISNGTTLVIATGTYANSLAVYGLTSNETLTQVIRDTANGTTRVNYPLIGFAQNTLNGSSSSINNTVVNSNNLSTAYIGPGATATFTAFAQDTSLGQLQFQWLAGTLDGWLANFTETDLPSPSANNLYKSQITLSLANQTQGPKDVHCTVTNLTTLESINFETAINLIAPLPPVITSISTDAPFINGAYTVSQAGFVHFSATASDPNNALLTYEWIFLQPLVSLYGQEVMLRPADYSIFAESNLESSGTNTGGPLPIQGQLSVRDRYGQSTTVAINDFITTLVWPFSQVSPQTSGTGSTTLQVRYWGVSTLISISQQDLSGFNSDFGSSRNSSNSFSPVSQFIYIVYPESFGNAIIDVNGTIATDWLLTQVTFNSVLYNVYRSSTPLSGIFQVTIS